MPTLVTKNKEGAVHGLRLQDETRDSSSAVDPVAKRNGLVHDKHVGAGGHLYQRPPRAAQNDDKNPRVSGLMTKALSLMPDTISISTSGWALAAAAMTSTRE